MSETRKISGVVDGANLIAASELYVAIELKVYDPETGKRALTLQVPFDRDAPDYWNTVDSWKSLWHKRIKVTVTEEG